MLLYKNAIFTPHQHHDGSFNYFLNFIFHSEPLVLLLGHVLNYFPLCLFTWILPDDYWKAFLLSRFILILAKHLGMHIGHKCALLLLGVERAGVQCARLELWACTLATGCSWPNALLGLRANRKGSACHRFATSGLDT